jgi:hypothetical protein
MLIFVRLTRLLQFTPERSGEGGHEGKKGSFISLVLLVTVGSCWEGTYVTRKEGVDRTKGIGRAPPPSERWAENTIITECMQENEHLQSIYSLVCGISPSTRPCSLWCVDTILNTIFNITNQRDNCELCPTHR